MTPEDRLRFWVEELCSPACAGRATGSPGGRQAREIVVGALRAAGTAPELQKLSEIDGANVLARVPGSGQSGVVLVGAHYDHLGVLGRDTFWGADDNAAAVALLVELARTLVAAPAASDVLLVAFDAEEPPHFLTGQMGSMAFAERPPVPLGSIKLMIALDLVGHAVGPEHAPARVRQSLFALGAEKTLGAARWLETAAAAAPGVAVRPLGLDVVPPLSDYEAFRRRGVPSLFLTCGRWRHYHTPSDTPDKLDYGKLAEVTRFVEALVREAAAEVATPPFDPERRDHAGTIASLRGMARELAELDPRATAAEQALAAIAARARPDGSLPLSDWSGVLQILALLEQGLA